MAVENEGQTKAFTAGEALAAHRLVYLSAEDTVSYCDAEHSPIGVTTEDKAIGLEVNVRLLNMTGTKKIEAADAIDVLDPVFAAADGKVNDVDLGVMIGFALHAASAAGSIIEVLCLPAGGVGGGGDDLEVIGGVGGIAAGDLVYISDQTDGKPTVLKAQGTTGGNFAQFICPNAIAAGAVGIAKRVWLKHGYDTSAAGAVNDPVYLSDTAAGANVFTKPTGTDKVQVVGRVIEDHAATGAVLFQLPGDHQISHNHTDASEGGGLTSPHITTGLKDANGAEAIDIAATGSAVDHIGVTNAVAGSAPSIKAKGDTTHVSLELGAKGNGVAQVTAPLVEKMTQVAEVATVTLTAEEILKKIIDGTPTAAATYTLPTAALLVAAIPDCKVGDSFKFVVNNLAAGADTITMAGGTGSTDDGTLTVAQHVIREFLVQITNVTGTSEAYNLYGIGT